MSIAIDGQSLATQSPNTRAAFEAAYGDRAAEQWVREHHAALGFDGHPDRRYQVGGQVLTVRQLADELRGAGYTGPWSERAILDTYARLSGLKIGPPGSGDTTQTALGEVAGIVSTQGQQQTTTSGQQPGAPSLTQILARPIGDTGVPMWLAGAGAFGFMYWMGWVGRRR